MKNNNNKKRRKELELINSEGPILKLYKADDNEFVIYDQWDSIVEILTFDDLCLFFDGKILLTDSEGRKWDWLKENHDGRQNFKNIYNYISEKIIK
jgi:hypothetical protein